MMWRRPEHASFRCTGPCPLLLFRGAHGVITASAIVLEVCSDQPDTNAVVLIWAFSTTPRTGIMVLAICDDLFSWIRKRKQLGLLPNFSRDGFVGAIAYACISSLISGPCNTQMLRNQSAQFSIQHVRWIGDLVRP